MCLEQTKKRSDNNASFDFSAAPEDSKQPECTYTTFQSNEETATPGEADYDPG